MEKISIRKLSNKDIPNVALIHYKYLKLGVLSHLGRDFLEKFYQVLLAQRSTFTLVATFDNSIAGFATGATNLNIITKIMISNLWFPTLVTIVKNPSLIIKLAQMPFYPSFKENKKIGEIFTIAVKPEYRRKKIGTLLIKECAKEFKTLGYRVFQVSVRKKMKAANLFYQKLGLSKKREARFLGEEIIFYYGKL